MRFTDPLYLLLFIPLLAGLLYSFRLVHGMAKGRKRLAFAIRFLLIGSLIFALAGPEARRPNEGVATMFVLDLSDSISENDKKQAEAFIREATSKLGPKDVSGVVAFGKDALIDAAPGGKRSLNRILSTVDGSASDVASAIRLASAAFPEGKARRIVVLSDGNETSGDAIEAAQVAATDGIEVDHVPLGLQERKGEASVVALEAPTETRTDQPFDLRVVVDSTRDQKAQIDVDRDGVLFKKLNVELTKGRNSIVVSDGLKDPGFHRYRATLKAQGDLDSRNNVGLGFVAIRGKPRILILQESTKDTTLSSALARNGIATDVLGPASIPTKAEDLQVYDAIVFNDINAYNFTDQQMKLVQTAVRDSGVGFAMVGGENSFLPGGYYGSTIAEVLPVDLNIRQRKTFPSTSICIMADASGSMGMVEDGFPKIRLAAKAAEETVKLMSPMDRVGVAGSSDGIEFVAPMQKLTDKGSVISQIRKLNVGGGGIYIQPSMLKAEEVLNKENSKVRHFILLADGADSDSQEGAIQTALRMRANKITTTVVSIGDGKDVKFLKNLALAGGGRFYLAKKAGQLPAIFTQDASVMSRSAIEEGAFIPKMSSAEEILRGISDTGVPPLLAYCLTDSRALSTVGMRTHKDDPLLAKWQYGLGTSLAFMSDAQPRWAKHWVSWPGFGTFWSQTARAISRRATLNNYQVAVRNEAGKGKIDVKAFDRLGNPMTATNATVRVAAPDGTFREISLEQQAPGAYEGAFDASAIGTYIVTVAEPDMKGGIRTSATGFSMPYPAEYRSYRSNRPLLERVSKLTNGKELKNPLESIRPVPNPGASITELWPLFLLIAALLLPLDVGVRRIALPLGEILAKGWDWVKSLRTRETVTQQQVVVGRLHQAKQRAKTTVGEAPENPVMHEREEQPVVQASTQKGASAATSLLEAKRKKKD